MRRGQRASSSSESEESQRPWFDDSEEQSSLSARTSGEDSSSSDSDTEAEMKRSERFSTSFSFKEDEQPEPEPEQDRGEEKEEEEEEEEQEQRSPGHGEPVTQQVGTEPVAVSTQAEKQEGHCNRGDQRSGLFRPQQLWLAMTRCLALRWPHCFSINRKLAFQADLNQSEDAHLSLTSESTNQSSSTSSSSDDRESAAAAKRQEEEVASKRVKSAPPPRRGISRSSPRCPRQARQITDSVLASVILERETFLRIELTDSGEERDDLRYRAEWKLSERTKELAEGVWLSRSPMK